MGGTVSSIVSIFTKIERLRQNVWTIFSKIKSCEISVCSGVVLLTRREDVVGVKKKNKGRGKKKKEV